MVTFSSDNPHSCGILETDNKGVMIDFIEKPQSPKSNLANGAIYLFDDNFIDYLRKIDSEKILKDFSKDVIPLMKNKINTWHTEDYIIDIGTPENLKKAMELDN